MVGGLIMAVMSNGMQLMGVEQQIQSVVKGLVLLLAVAFARNYPLDRKRHGEIVAALAARRAEAR